MLEQYREIIRERLRLLVIPVMQEFNRQMDVDKTPHPWIYIDAAGTAFAAGFKPVDPLRPTDPAVVIAIAQGHSIVVSLVGGTDDTVTITQEDSIAGRNLQLTDYLAMMSLLDGVEKRIC